MPLAAFTNATARSEAARDGILIVNDVRISSPIQRSTWSWSSDTVATTPGDNGTD